jgi:hypothetical protein
LVIGEQMANVKGNFHYFKNITVGIFDGSVGFVKQVGFVVNGKPGGFLTNNTVI